MSTAKEIDEAHGGAKAKVSVSRTPETPMTPGKIKDRLSHLRISRGTAKGMLTKNNKKLKQLMEDEANFDHVLLTEVDFDDNFERFLRTQDRYHSFLLKQEPSCEDIDTAEDYAKTVEANYMQLKDEILQWVKQVSEGRDRSGRQLPEKPVLSSTPKPSAPAKRLSFQNESHNESLLQVICNQERLVQTLQLPKAELIHYDGDPLSYWQFIRSFENFVERDVVDANAKLMRLLQYCTGRARTAIQHCAVMEPERGYELARATLQKRFGDQYTIVESWVQKITTGPSLKPSDKRAIRDYADDIRCCVETLQSMGRIGELDNNKAMVSIVSRLPGFLALRWRKEAHDVKRRQQRMINVIDLARFVEDAAEELNDPVFGDVAYMDSRKSSGKDQSIKKFDGLSQDRKKTSSFSAQARNGKEGKFASQNTGYSFGKSQFSERNNCPNCNEKHTLFYCNHFKAMKPSQRLEFVLTKNLCKNCLLPGHWAAACGKPTTCSVPGCGKKHTKFIHPLFAQGSCTTGMSGSNQRSPQNVNAAKNQCVNDARQQLAPVTHVETQCNFNGAGRVALPVVPVHVRVPGSQFSVKTYALLDTGSTNTFCTESLAKLLGVKGMDRKLTLTTLEAKNVVTNSSIVSLQAFDVNFEDCVDLPFVFTRKELPITTGRHMEVNKWDHLRELCLPDIDMDNIGLLIGQDVPDALVPKEVRSGGKGEPYAVRTIFGWSISGPLGVASGCQEAVSGFVRTDQELTDLVKQFWKIETGDEPAISVSDKKVLKLWQDTVARDPDGHPTLPIPFKLSNPGLPDNFRLAESRLMLLGKRFHKDESFRQKYSEEVEVMLNKGWAELVPEEQLVKDDGKVWYLPHHAVYNVHKEKLRVVFDCSAVFKGTSLNKEVSQGPNLTSSLIGVLTRFRIDPLAFIADIEKMFYQVRVNSEDRDVLRFLWWPNGDLSQAPQVYRMKVHIFGGIWSPSASSFALRNLAESAKGEFSEECIRTVLRHFYVDDCLKSVGELERGRKLVSDICSLLLSGGFKLTKWTSNSRELLGSIPCSEWSKELKDIDLDRDALPVERALGVIWNTDKDCFTFKVVVPKRPLTRRGLLSILCSVYDPLGIVSPFVLVAKLILQELCRRNLDWDDSIPDEMIELWQQWLRDLLMIEMVRIPRCVKPVWLTDITSIQLHHFSDASERAYASVSYLRMVDMLGNISCSFIISKSRLAPLRSITIPRLELSAAVLSAKSDKLLRQELDIDLHDSVYWTDSTIVLQYLKNEDKRYQTFVANRIAIILEDSKFAQWHHVDSCSNPADDCSRGLSASEVVNKERWINGPEFLWRSKEHWPKSDICQDLPSQDPELKSAERSRVFAASTGEDSFLDPLIERCSSWHQLKKSVAWLIKVKKELLRRVKEKQGIVLKPTTEKFLLVDDLSEAERSLIQYVQIRHFGDEIAALNKC